MRKSAASRSGTAKRLGVDRREFLQTGAAALGAATMANWAVTGHALPSALRNRAVIFVFLAGGPSHLDTYDLKPDAPAEIRGEFRPIHTNVPGIRVCEHLPLHAKIADKFAIVHGVEMLDAHSDAVPTTGYLPAWQRPAFADIACPNPEPWARRYLSLQNSSPSSAAGCLHSALELAEQGMPAGVYYLSGDLLPGGNWDTHGRVLGRQSSIFEELREKLPVYDHALHTLITNLYDRGLDQNVLVVVCGEFGRTPRINRHGGRDHWAPCTSVLFAGGGFRMGQTIGDTGPIGERSRSELYTAQNVLAMIYRHLGIDPATTIVDADSRQSPLLHDRRLIAELI